MGKKISKRIRTAGAIILIFSLMVLSSGVYFAQTKQSMAATVDSADLRFIFTTDLHGSLTTTDYELGEPYNVGSLSKAITLIEEAREEKAEGNSFTFDVGDMLYDYTTESIFEMDPGAIQPILQAMNTVGYDAITLGNHEFDYGYDYITKQILGAGLKNICVVSNLKDAKNGKTVFDENMMISRKVTTKNGKKVTVNIGIIGETIPVLSRKRENYIGTLVPEDIIENTKKEAAKLKKEGADIIVVLAHSGFGTENPTEFSKDVSYALTKIDEVDVVLCGHEHHMFPSDSVDSAKYYKLPGVNKDTGLVNGKNLVMASDRGRSIGIVDLTLKISGSNKTISKRSSKVRQVKASTAVNTKIEEFFGKWKEVFTAATNNILGNVADGQSLNNYLGIVEDTNSIQLLNNSKIYYALQYIYSTGTSYQGYPVIAASNHNRDGQMSSKDYANITGEITEANLSAIAPFNKYVFLYEVTGKQLKEWLEWTASAYQTTNKSVEWTDEAMNTVMKEAGTQSLIAEEWLDEWGPYYVFDGINYTIDPSVEPRYNYDGDKINTTNRISSITYNGTPVTDGMKFVLATDPLTNVKKDCLTDMQDHAIVKGINKNITIMGHYISMLSKVGDIIPFTDDNWKLDLPENYDFVLKVSQNGRSEINKNNWSDGLITNINEYDYYKVHFNRDDTDTQGPNLVVASSNEKSTNLNVKIAVSATDPSGIKTIRYAYGSYDKNYPWQQAAMVKDTFTAAENGIYTVYAEDNNGNGTVSRIHITNINRGILQVPSINSYTNRTTRITGTAEPSSTIYFKTVDGVYETVVGTDGAFSYELPSQRAGDTVSAYTKDSSGRTSETVTVPVKRTGPNRPVVDAVDNTKLQVTGNTNQDSVAQVFVVAGGKVFVSPNGGAEAYQNCEKYVSSYDIVKTPVQITKDGRFYVDTNGINAETLVTVYTLDFAGRLSKANMSNVAEIGPNPPVIYSVCNAENTVSGRIYNKKEDTVYDVTLTVNGQTYKAVTDMKGYFTAEVGAMEAGQNISIYATDVVDNVTRTSAVIKKQVQDIKNIIESAKYQYMFLDEITNKSTNITGTCLGGDTAVTIKVGDQFYEVTSDYKGDFDLELPSALKAGTEVSAVYRELYSNSIDADMKSVTVGKPYPPEILNAAIYNTTQKLTILSKEKGSVTVEAGGETYTSKKYTLDESLGIYVYEVKIKNVNSGSYISVYATNSAGNSPKLQIPVAKRAPDTPVTQPVYTSTTAIKGNVELLLNTGSATQEIPTVSNTGTKVYAKINNKIYTAVIKDDGSFEIKIPKQKVNTSITVWGANSQGKGPEKVIKVLKAKK